MACNSPMNLKYYLVFLPIEYIFPSNPTCIYFHINKKRKLQKKEQKNYRKSHRGNNNTSLMTKPIINLVTSLKGTHKDRFYGLNRIPAKVWKYMEYSTSSYLNPAIQFTVCASKICNLLLLNRIKPEMEKILRITKTGFD